VPPLLLDDETESDFLRWFQLHRPDAILCLQVSLARVRQFERWAKKVSEERDRRWRFAYEGGGCAKAM
jgi:hypothetical protein